MSQLGKIFLGIALVGALLAIGFGWLDISDYKTQTAALKQTQFDVAAERQNVTKANQAAAAAQAETATTKTQLTEVQKKVDDLNSQLTDATKKQTDLQAAVQAATDATTKAQAELTRVSGVLKNKAPEEVMADIDKLNAQVAADNAQQEDLAGPAPGGDEAGGPI